MAEEVLYGVEAGVGRITIDRPARGNAMSGPVLAAMRDLLARARADPGVRVVVLTGAGDRAFSTGVDLAAMADVDPPSLLAAHERWGELAGVFLDLWALGKPTIARVRGRALAGGFGLALACDLVIASDDAQFGTPEVDLGLWPHMVTVPLVRSMPPKKALELMLTGRLVGAEEAERIGFVNRVVAADALDTTVGELAAALAAKPAGAVKLGRDAFYAVWDLAASEALEVLHPLLTLTTMTEDAREGLAAFAEKRDPRWRAGG